MILSKLKTEPLHHQASARGLRNVGNFAQFMKWTNKSPEAILQLGEFDNKAGLSPGQFQNLMKKIQFKISQEEVAEVFHIIDKSKNGVITLDELAEIAKKS